jgi:hypothetical protein
MKLDVTPRLATIALALAVTGSLLIPSVAEAEEVVVVETGYRGPDTTVLGSGVVVFGGTYLASAIVAGTSSHPGDHYLWAPIVGPWLDMANRCSGIGPCEVDTGRKVLLGFDGVFQALGLLSVASSFLMPPRRSRALASREPTTAFHVLPAVYGRTPGLALAGTF